MLSRTDDDRRGGSERRFYTLMVHREIYRTLRPSSRSEKLNIPNYGFHVFHVSVAPSTVASSFVIMHEARNKKKEVIDEYSFQLSPRVRAQLAEGEIASPSHFS